MVRSPDGRAHARGVPAVGWTPAGRWTCGPSSRARTTRCRSASATTRSGSSAGSSASSTTDRTPRSSSRSSSTGASQDSHIVDVTLVIDGQTLRSSAAAPTHQAGHRRRRSTRSSGGRSTTARRAASASRPRRVRHGGGADAGERRRRPARRRGAPRPDRQGQALQHRADVRGGRGRADGGARARVLRVRERGERAGRDPVPAARRRLRPDRADGRRRLHEGRPARPLRSPLIAWPNLLRASASTCRWVEASDGPRIARSRSARGTVQVFVDNPTAWKRRTAPPRGPRRRSAHRFAAARRRARGGPRLVPRQPRRPGSGLPRELDRGARLRHGGCGRRTARRIVNVHTGSHRDTSVEAGIERVATGVAEVLARAGAACDGRTPRAPDAADAAPCSRSRTPPVAAGRSGRRSRSSRGIAERAGGARRPGATARVLPRRRPRLGRRGRDGRPRRDRCVARDVRPRARASRGSR